MTEPGSGDQLSRGPVRHVVRAGGLTVAVEYTTTPPIHWTSDGGTPVLIAVTVRNDREPRQKIYLSRATLRFVVNDGTSSLPGPEPLVDNANITPGYLATTPYSYVQSFPVPAVDRSAQQLTVNVKLELVSLVDRKAKDYTKYSVTDAVTTSVLA